MFQFTKANSKFDVCVYFRAALASSLLTCELDQTLNNQKARKSFQTFFASPSQGARSSDEGAGSTHGEEPTKVKRKVSPIVLLSYKRRRDGELALEHLR